MIFSNGTTGLRIYCADRKKRGGNRHPSHFAAISLAGCGNSSELSEMLRFLGTDLTTMMHFTVNI